MTSSVAQCLLKPPGRNAAFCIWGRGLEASCQPITLFDDTGVLPPQLMVRAYRAGTDALMRQTRPDFPSGQQCEDIIWTSAAIRREARRNLIRSPHDRPSSRRGCIASRCRRPQEGGGEERRERYTLFYRYVVDYDVISAMSCSRWRRADDRF